MRTRRDIDAAEPLIVGQRVTVACMGYEGSWSHAAGVLSRMEDTETGVIVHVTGDDGSRLSAHISRKGIKNGRVQEGVDLCGTDYRIQIEKGVTHRQYQIPMLAQEASA